MLEPQRMDRVLVVGTKDVMETTINTLHKMDIFHVEDYTEEGEYFHIGKPLKSATSLSEKLLKLRSMRSYLGTKSALPFKEKREKILTGLEQNLTSLEATVNQKMNEKSSLETSLKDLAHREELLKPYEALGLPLQLLYGYDHLAVYTGTVPKDIEPQVKAVTDEYELFSAPYGKNTIIALFVPKTVAPKISELLLKNDYMEMEPLKESGEPAAIKKSIAEKTVELKAKLESTNAEIKELDKKYADFILASEELLSIDTQKAEAPLKFATSDNTFVVDGWVPTKDFERLKDALVKATDDRVYVTTVEPQAHAYKGEVEPGVKEHHEIDAPVAYNNPRAFHDWQTFIDLVARPKYDEIDPTMIFAFVFPMFYGFILGDIGYGLLLLAICLVLRHVLKNSEGMLLLINVMLVCSISTIFFGFLFGEFLGYNMSTTGFLGINFASLYPHAVTIGPIGPFSLPLERLVAGGPSPEYNGSYVFGIKDLLVLTCVVGVCQILLGYAFGFRNEYRQHGLKTAILHKVSWALMLIGGVAMVWYAFPMAMNQQIAQINVMNPLFLGGVIAFLIGVIMLLMGEGVVGLLEIPNLMSNTLSYTRLLAVGLSSVGIAFAINTVAAMLASAGTLGLIAAIIVFIVGHGINLVLGIYAPFIQSLRLHYVEFFMKFYKGGGRIYDPFGYNRKYTED